MLTVSDVQALIVITLGDAFVLNRRVRQQATSGIGHEVNEARTFSAMALPAAGVSWWYTERTCWAHNHATSTRRARPWR